MQFNQNSQIEENPLLAYFIANGGNIIHKWVDYFEIYHKFLNKFRNKPIKLLEIGVQNGGDIQMWKKYFGPQLEIVGIDIDPACKNLETNNVEIWIGDQADPAFLEELKADHSEFDIIIDDGGHTMQQQITTFEHLFPTLKDGGIFICEDTHTSYFPAHGGGINKKDTFIEYAKNLIDEMHAWYHAPLAEIPNNWLTSHLHSISFFDSIVAFEKRSKNPPLILARGQQGHMPPPAAMSFLDMRRAFGVPDQ